MLMASLACGGRLLGIDGELFGADAEAGICWVSADLSALHPDTTHPRATMARTDLMDFILSKSAEPSGSRDPDGTPTPYRYSGWIPAATFCWRSA